MTTTLTRRPVDPPPSSSATTRRRRAPPALTVLAVLAVVPAAIPVGFLVWSVLRPGGVDAGGFGAARLAELLVSTMVLVVTVTATTLVLGVATAWLTTRTDLPGRRVWSTLAALPLVIPSYVGALALLGATGNRGLSPSCSAGSGSAAFPVHRVLGGMGGVSLWNFPFVHLLTVPALRRLDPSVEEAALGSERAGGAPSPRWSSPS